MAKEFADQGGVATMNPPAIVRWATSKLMSRLWRASAITRRRAKAERVRKRKGAPHRVEYFHQVDDGYSQLAAQLLEPLVGRYEIDLVVHLVSAEASLNLPEPDLLRELSRYDSGRVAPHYGLRFPTEGESVDPELSKIAIRIIAAHPEGLWEVMVKVGEALWTGNRAALEELGRVHGMAEPDAASDCVAHGNARREKLGHYSGAMFYYGGEWYWGVDRVYHLEERLVELGASKVEPGSVLFPRPEIEFGPLRDDGRLTLEIYPSLRSPYTSLIFDHAVRLAEKTGVRMMIRPVLPMVMRGVPATRQKGFYIFSDAAREARSLGLEWGLISDPIGEPVRNVYSLYPWAVEQGRGTPLLRAFLHAAFFDGVNTNTPGGMQTVVENAGLDWSEARGIMGNSDWEGEFEANRLAMYKFGSWGVPSFRLLDEKGSEILGLWGQDRLWLFSREIQRLLRARGGAEHANSGTNPRPVPE